MGFYTQVIVPLLCDFGLDRPFVARYRRELLAHSGGDILEIGFGTGLNLPYYPGGVHKLTAVDPNPGMHRLAQKRIKQGGIEVDQHVLKGERLPFEDSRFDCAVSTFTLSASRMSVGRCGNCTGCSNWVARSCSSNTASARSRACRSGSAA